MKCTDCQFENPEDSVFCLKCGEKLETICPQCGKALPAFAGFCNKCGHNLTVPSEEAPKDLSFDEKIAKIQRYLPEGLTEKILSQKNRIEGERKQVTVMFCDMEGFTQLTERLGPEEAYSIMDHVYEILIHKVHDYEGTVNEMTGDGIVALFGAPIALEDAPQRAIRSAMAIHREMTRFSDTIRKEETGVPPLKMRVGIHTGPVVVGTLGNDLRVDFKAVGDTVNLASRMEQLAGPGTTYVTEETFRLTEGFFRFESLGEQEIKGKEQAINVYQVIAPSTRRTRFDVSAERGLTPFVGRERELELLLDGFERAKADRGQAFSIVAEAGVGKSRLLYEFRKAVANEDMTFLEGKSLSYSRGVAYHPVIDMLKSNFDIREDEGDAQIIEKVKGSLRALGEDEVSFLPYLLELLSVKEIGTDTSNVSPETRKERILEALKAIVIRGAEIRPLIMAFEDLHWMDGSSEDVLKSLLDNMAGARVLLLFTYRPEFVQTWGGRSYHNQLNLVRLSNRESLLMVTHLLGTEQVDRQLEELVLEKTEGVPFFIEEFVQSVKELEIIERRNNRYCLTKTIDEVGIPSTIQDVIMARIDSLPEDSKETLQTASAIDREFSYELIRRVTDLPEQELLSRLSCLRDSELLYERGIYPKSTYIFKHALTQEVAYSSLLSKSRKQMHEKIGLAIEELNDAKREEHCEVLAYHYLRSENKYKAVDYLVLANQKAIKAIAVEEARGYFDSAMALLDELPDTKENLERRISMLVKQRTMFNLDMKMPEYQGLLKQNEAMLAVLENPGLSGLLKAELGFCACVFGDFDEAIATLKEAVRLRALGGNVGEVKVAHQWLAWSYLFKGEFERVLELKEETIAKMGKQFPLRPLVYAYMTASIAYAHLGQWDEAIANGKEGLEIAQRRSDNSVSSFASSFLIIALILKGDLKAAVEYGELALEKAPTAADRAWATGFLGWEA